ncbi:MAG: HAMP domain-containing histidine kinase [Bacteroidales bacterium]|nr:HAMP domain-containing histidine kinase [Bacteroidales bacterium]
MRITGSRTAGMAFLPQWLSADPNQRTLETLFADWVKTSGWERAGLIERPRGPQSVLWEAGPSGIVPPSTPPDDWDTVAEELTQTTENDAVRLCEGHLLTLVQVPGTDSVLLWVRVRDAGCDALDRAYLRLSAEMMRHSRVVTHAIPGVDSHRLWERLQDVAVVAGRVAHDFDNILTGVLGFAELGLAQTETGSQLENFLQKIAESGKRGNDLTRLLHQFNRMGQTRTRPGSLQPILERELRALSTHSERTVQVTHEIPPTLPWVAMEETMCGLVLRNLLQNAVEAFPAGGGRVHVRVRSAQVTVADTQRFWGHLATGPSLEITITDSGCGIPPTQQRERLFATPLVTTKYRHRGLGLPTVFRILYLHKAGIRLEPRPDHQPGTCVRLLIPLARPESEASA